MKKYNDYILEAEKENPLSIIARIIKCLRIKGMSEDEIKECIAFISGNDME